MERDRESGLTSKVRADIDRPGAFRLLTDHAGVWIPGLYLFASAIGMLDSWWYHRRFGINVFLYSDLADFLLASFRTLTPWFVVVLSALAYVGDQAASTRTSRSRSVPRALRWYGSTGYRRIGRALIIPAVLAYIVLVAGIRADLVYDGRAGREVRVTLTDAPASAKTAILFGGTLNFLFLFERSERNVSIHPYQNVLAIEFGVPSAADEMPE
jgi:hypothetical protein